MVLWFAASILVSADPGQSFRRLTLFVLVMVIAAALLQWPRTIGHFATLIGAGTLATLSEPRAKYAFKVDRIVPLGDAKEGANTFRVYADLTNADPRWLPGVTGEARIDVEKQPYIWVWTHRLVDWVRLKLWM